MMDVHITCKKLIKPSVPTPIHLQNMRISFIDQHIYPTTVPVIFYYPAANRNHHHPSETVERQNRLEKSLSEILSLYYPLAGRYIKEKLIVNCNDEGIDYVEALVDGQLPQILHGKVVEAKELNQFVPDQVEESATSPFVAIQVSIFKCGGLAIGLRFSHRIMDAFTLSLFVNGWAKMCKVGINDVITPNFESGILFPARDIVSDQQKLQTSFKTRLPKVVVVTMRFVFDAKAISKLKAEAFSSFGLKYCQFSVAELMIAWIWRAQISAARARHGCLRTSLLSVPMNLRGKTFENIPNNCFGNLFTLIIGRFPEDHDESKMGLNDMINLVRDTIRNSMEEYAKPMKGEDEFFSKMMKPGREIIEEFRKGNGDLRTFTSWRNLGIYEVDFGWGKPGWVSVAERPHNGVILMDTKDGGGIEAWVTMNEEEMPYFQHHPDITNFTSS
ncbi:hypothetical protein ACOSQ3_004831 [Xanthoceras sorbifolium]